MTCQCVYNHGTHADGTCKGCGFAAPKRDVRPARPKPIKPPPAPSVPPGYYDEHEAGRFTITKEIKR